MTAVSADLSDAVVTPFMVELTLADGTLIQIESRWSLWESGRNVVDGRIKDFEATKGHILALVGTVVVGILVEEQAGSMTIQFENGMLLEVLADPHFEAWNLRRKDGMLLVSLPGGGVNRWRPKE
ncbi:DUF6188 family protein [Microbacterium sp. 22195]|uniref:DUF6188 family protein n=1 Tax=Microbacterium sp. 22195 TaxID=3453891 RepID=UPI003F874B4D